MLIKISEATNKQLDYLVAQCEGILDHLYLDKHNDLMYRDLGQFQYDEGMYHPTTNWGQGGSIILNMGRLDLIQYKHKGYSDCDLFSDDKRLIHMRGETILIAAMRCYVASKLGKEVDIPEDLK